MKNTIKIGLFSLLFGMTACQQSSTTIESVNAEKFSEVIDASKVQILDVRTSEEYAEGHLAKSININVLEEGFTEKAQNVLNKKSTVALYCRSGRRSKKAADLLHQAGFKVVELAGGINEWKEKNLEIVK